MSTERELSFSEGDLINPLAWLERLSQEELKEWLRRSFWTQQTLPVMVPPTSRNALEISSLLKQGSSNLKIRVRKVIPELLQEWGRDDPMMCLDDLLIVCGRLRCAGAAVVIAQIISERLAHLPEAVALRQRGLSVLSGFGCTDRTVHIFERYINDIEYAAICYRALYRYDFSYAATALPGVIKLFESSAVADELRFVISTLADDLPSANEAMELHTRYLRISEPNDLVNTLEIFREVGLLTTTLIMEARSEQRKQFSNLLLARCSPQTFPTLLRMLEVMGISLHSIHAKNGEETMQLRVVDRNTNQKIAEDIIATSKLPHGILDTLVDANEPLAFSAYAGMTKYTQSH